MHASEPVMEKEEGEETWMEGHIPFELVDDEHCQPHKHHGEQHQHGRSTVGWSQVHQWGWRRKQGMVMGRDVDWRDLVRDSHCSCRAMVSLSKLRRTYIQDTGHTADMWMYLSLSQPPECSGWPVQEAQWSQAAWIQGCLCHMLVV